MEATIPYYPLIVVPVAVAVYLFWRRGRWHMAVLRAAQPLDRSDRPLERIKGLAVFVVGQRRLLNDIGPGLTHAFVFWGFVVLLATTGNYLTNGLVEAILGWPFGGFLWGVAIFFGPLSTLLEPMGAAAGVAGYGIFGWTHILLVLAFGSYLPYSKHLHIISSEPNVYFRNLEPRGALRPMDLEAEATDGEEPVFGARTLGDLTWRHLLDGLACTECGRCMEFCPASMTGKTLSPKHLMEGLRDQMVAAETALSAAASAQRAAKAGANGGGEASQQALSLAKERAEEALTLPLVDNAIPEEAVWQCVTCGWCVEACPVLIEHVDTIVEIRRNLVLEESSFPKELNAAFRNMENAGNPWGQPNSARLDWAKGLDVPVLGGTDAAAPPDRETMERDGVLYWVGCAGAFDDRNRKVVRSIVQLLK